MAINRQNSDHEAIWDDSALIDSWNTALAEYKKYHSISATGANTLDLEPGKVCGFAGKNAPIEQEKRAYELPHSSEDEGEIVSPSESHLHEAATAEKEKPVTDSKSRKISEPLFPNLILGSTGDDYFRKLLMSWYYAGYYTGLYEGKQQAEPSSSG